MNQNRTSDQIAGYLHTEYYLNDATKLTLLQNGVRLLIALSSIWTSDADEISDVCDRIIDGIKNASFDEQKGLVFVAQHVLHCLTEGEHPQWHDRRISQDSGLWWNRDFHHHPIVWLFRFDVTQLLDSRRIMIRPDTQEKRDVLAMLCDSEKQWRTFNTKDDYKQRNGLAPFAEKLKNWGKLVRGFTVLDKLHVIWKSPIDTASMCNTLVPRIRDMPKAEQEALKFLLSYIAESGSSSWVVKEDELVRSQQFRVSAYLWTIDLGALELTQGWRRNETTLKMLSDQEQQVLFSDPQDVAFQPFFLAVLAQLKSSCG